MSTLQSDIENKPNKKLFNTFKNLIIGTVFAAIVIVVVFAWFNYANVITINKHSYTNSDISKLYKVEMMIAQKTNQNTIQSKKDVLYNLAQSEIQAKVLTDFGVQILREQSIQRLEELIVDKALLSEIQSLLDDRYYDLFVRPVVVREVFRSFYINNNPNQTLASSLLSLAQQIGFDESLNQLNLDPQILLIPNDPNNKQFFDDISKFIEVNGLGNRVFNKIINFQGGYLVMVPEQINEEGLIVRGYLVQYNNVREYLMQKANQTDIQFGFTNYDYTDLVRDDGIFSIR